MITMPFIKRKPDDVRRLPNGAFNIPTIVTSVALDFFSGTISLVSAKKELRSGNQLIGHESDEDIQTKLRASLEGNEKYFDLLGFVDEKKQSVCSYEKCLTCSHEECVTGQIAREKGIEEYNLFLKSFKYEPEESMYLIEVTETLQRSYVVRAKHGQPEDALRQVYAALSDGRIELDCECMTDRKVCLNTAVANADGIIDENLASMFEMLDVE